MRQWSSYQVKMFDRIKEMHNEEPSALVVEAVPGSGKTTTSVESMRLIDVRHSVAVLAFNKAIAEEMKRRVPPNCEATTINSFGFRAVKAVNPRVRMDQWKTRNIMKVVVPNPEQRKGWEGTITRLVGLRKATVKVGIDRYELASWDEICERYDVDAPGSNGFKSALDQVWTIALNDTSNIDFDDQWFHPIWYDLPIPQFDWVFVDEAQDLSSTQIELLRRIAPRIVAVGDPRQSIYGFRGADSEAMTRLREATNAKVLPLSICYRCPSKVIELANKVFNPEGAEGKDVIVAAPGAEPGVVDDVKLATLRKECAPGSFVLCRTTAPLVKECLKFIVEGVRACVKGRDVGQQLALLIDKVLNSSTVNGGSRSMDIVRFTEFLDSYFESEKARLQAAQRDQQLQALEDRVECIYALSEGARTVDDIFARMDKVFSEEGDKGGVTFATAHRTKGLEADDIYILCPELMPFPKAKSEWAKLQEKNLQFVAYTRAMKRLRFVRN